MSRLVSIYALLDESGAVRYIGRTVLPPQARLAAHLKDRTGRAKTSWLREMQARGVLPAIVVLDVVPEEQAPEAEAREIAAHRARGCSLTNGRQHVARGFVRGSRAPDRITVRLPEELIDEIERIAARELTPLTVLVRRWLNERLAQERQHHEGQGR